MYGSAWWRHKRVTNRLATVTLRELRWVAVLRSGHQEVAVEFHDLLRLQLQRIALGASVGLVACGGPGKGPGATSTPPGPSSGGPSGTPSGAPVGMGSGAPTGGTSPGATTTTGGTSSGATTPTGVPAGFWTGTSPADACLGFVPIPGDLEIVEGYTWVPSGQDCPLLPGPLLQADSAIWWTYVGPTCNFAGELEGHYVSWNYCGTTFPATPAEVPNDAYAWFGPVDVCFYDAVFRDDGYCGRPLLREGVAVLASVDVRPGPWSGSGGAWDLDAIARERIGGYWLATARLEHASVASFARFTLDLMRFGAPPELLAAAQRAALDEIDHAKRCFDLASRAAGGPRSPGVLDAGGIGGGDVMAFAEALVREGCVGETLGAMEAAFRRIGATEPSVVETLAVIERDEAEHAALAWRTLRWLLETHDGGGRIHARVREVIEEEARRFDVAPAGPSARPVERAHGLVDEVDRFAVFREGFARVIVPAWASLGVRPVEARVEVVRPA